MIQCRKDAICMSSNQGKNIKTNSQYLILIIVHSSTTYSAKESSYCISMATMNTFVLLTATATPTTKMGRIVALPWQQWLRERATM